MILKSLTVLLSLAVCLLAFIAVRTFYRAREAGSMSRRVAPAESSQGLFSTAVRTTHSAHQRASNSTATLPAPCLKQDQTPEPSVLDESEIDLGGSAFCDSPRSQSLHLLARTRDSPSLEPCRFAWLDTADVRHSNPNRHTVCTDGRPGCSGAIS